MLHGAAKKKKQLSKTYLQMFNFFKFLATGYDSNPPTQVPILQNLNIPQDET